MKVKITLMILAAAAAVVALPSPRDRESPAVPHFVGLGDLPGGFFFSTATTVSADGNVVVGYSHSAGSMEAFRWTQADGMAGLGFPSAFAVSGDGSIVGGYRLVGDCVEPVRWTTRRGVDDLGALDVYHCGAVYGMSEDGSTVVGVVSTGRRGASERDVAFGWTLVGGLAPMEHLDEPELHSEAMAVSADGVVVVGASRREFGLREAFRWTSEAGPVGLGFLPGHRTSVAYGVSADGSVVVGCSGEFPQVEAFRWTEQTGMVSLGELPEGCYDSAAHGVSADGSVIVGRCTRHGQWTAFVWDATQGMRSVHDVLTSELDLGSALQGWKLLSAAAVSADGSVVVGSGISPTRNREAWIARLSAQPTVDLRGARSSGQQTANRH